MYSLGYQSDDRQSAYYLDDDKVISASEIKANNDMMESRGIGHENTRLRRRQETGLVTFDILQASAEESDAPQELDQLAFGAKVRLVQGSFSEQLNRICNLACAMDHAANEVQKHMIRRYIAHFRLVILATLRRRRKSGSKTQIQMLSSLSALSSSIAIHPKLERNLRALWRSSLLLLLKPCRSCLPDPSSLFVCCHGPVWTQRMTLARSSHPISSLLTSMRGMASPLALLVTVVS